MARLFGRDWTRAELTRRVGDMDQLAGVTAYEEVSEAVDSGEHYRREPTSRTRSTSRLE